MSDFNIKDFYNNKRYQDAIDYASNGNVRESFSEWDYLYLTNCYYNLKNYSDYLKIYKEFIAKYPDSKILDNKMGWCLYHLYIKNFNFGKMDKTSYFKRVDYILSRCDDTQFSPKTWVAKVVIDSIFKCKVGTGIDYSLGNKYLSFINPLTLEDDEQVISDRDGKERHLASPREQWYNKKTKALVELKQYDECLTYIDQAFRNVKVFHSNADHWLNYKRALCYYAQEKLDKAEETINSILSKYQHWCYYELLFDICVKKKDTSNALKYGAFCATADKVHKTRVKFYVKYADFLDEIGNSYEAALHLKLTELIRVEESWKQLQLPNNYQYPEDIIHMDKITVIRLLNNFWKKEKEKGVEFYEGVVDKLLLNGKSGFVKDNDGNSYYFNIRDFDKRDFRSVEEGKRVRFTLTERLDKKKNVMKLNAISISIVR